MNRRIFVIIVAGGSGQRMGAGIPKQFLLLDGKPILQRTIERFADAFDDAKFLVVLPEEHIDTWKGLCDRYSLGCPHTIVRGGISRYQSVRNALEKVPDGALVMIHDGVRPFASEDLLKRMVASMDETLCRALVPVLPMTDTLRSTEQDSQVIDRSKILRVQTPQVFFSEDIKAAYRGPFDMSFTDDASVAERFGVKIKTIPGESFNIKITTPEDMVFAKAILTL